MKKLICYAFIITALSLRAACAQDAASTPFRTTPAPDETVATPPEETPAPTETPTPTTKPATSATAKPAAQETEVSAPTATPARTGQTFSPVRALTPRPVATAKPSPKPERIEKPQKTETTEKPQKSEKPERTETETPEPESRSREPEASGNVADMIKRYEREWEAGIANHDTSVIQRLVANDFVGVSSTGRIGDKFTLLYEAKRDKNTYKNASARQLAVHTYGSTVAVVLGVTKESGTTASGRPFDHTYRFTDTWMERDGKWQCIAAHAAVAGKR